jgi:hypothetical protein
METISSLKYSSAVKKVREQKFKIMPVKRKGGWVPEFHDSAFMNDGSKIGIVVPVLQGNVLKEPLVIRDGSDNDGNPKFKKWEPEDIAALASELGLENVDLFNVYSQKNFWRGRTVNLNRNGLHLDCAKVDEFVNYLILMSDSDRIAPSWSERFNKGTYKFAIIGEGQEIEEKVSRTEDMKQAYTAFGRMDSSVDKMKDFLFVYYLHKKEAKRPPRDASTDWLKGEIGKIIDEDLTLFLELVSDKNYDTKLLITKSVDSGALDRQRHQYFIPGEQKPIGVLEEVIEFLDDDRNQDAKMKLIHHVENTSKK